MTIARVAAQDNNNVGTGFVTLTFPTNPTVGNLLIVAIQSLNPPGSQVTPTGWTLVIDGGFGAGGVTDSTSIFAKISAGAGDNATSFTSTGGGQVQGHMYEYSGAASTVTTEGAAASTGASGSVTSKATPAITTTDAGDLIFEVCAQALTNGGSATFATGTTLQANSQNRIICAERIPGSTVSGYTDTASWTTGRQAGSLIAAFKPAAVVKGSLLAFC